MINFTPKKTKNVLFLSIFASFLLIIGIFSMSACNKTEACKLTANYTKDTNAAQRTAMVAYCTANSINYTIDSSGVLYQIVTPGASTKVNLCESLSITYTGKLLTGTQFDAGTFSASLSQLVTGWQIVVPKIGKGGHMKILIPSTLAYGSQANGSIPANSPLFFDIVLN
jgi:FKBP-type peptidyl-prolyl cis-trans isomerase